MSPEVIAAFAATAVALLGLLLTLYLRWSARRVRVRVEVREAWTAPAGPLVWFSGSPAPPKPDNDVFEATIVATNHGERPIYIEVLGLYAVHGNWGFDDRLDRNLREVPPGGQASLVVDEEQAGRALRAGIIGFAELSTGEKVLSLPLGPVEPPNLVETP